MFAPTVPARRSPMSSLVSLMARYPLRSYFGIAFSTVWVLLLPFVLAQNGLGFVHVMLPDWAFIVAFIGGTIAGPTAGALIVTAAAEGKPGLRRFLRRYVQWRVPVRWYAVTLFGYFALYLVAAGIWVGPSVLVTFVTQSPKLVTSYLPLLIAMILFPAMIEEGGWRGFALPRLQARYGPLHGSLVLGFLHGLWHLPVYALVIGPAAMGPFDLMHVITNTVAIMAMTLVWTWVFNHAHGSILIGILLHAANNASGNFFDGLFPNLPPQVETTGYWLMIAAALLIVVYTRGRLGYKPDDEQAAVDLPGIHVARAA